MRINFQYKLIIFIMIAVVSYSANAQSKVNQFDENGKRDSGAYDGNYYSDICGKWSIC